MANNIKTNSLATLVAIRAAESAGYFTVGSKKYFANQLEGKRNGQTYRFVKKDTGVASNNLEIGSSDDTNIVESEVSLTLEPWHVAVKTNAIEGITDLELDAEVAEPNGQKLIQAAVKNQVQKDLGKCGTAFAGSGFAPLSMASAHLASVTNEELFGFVDPNIEAILTSNGQQFVPTSAPDMYSKGLLGKFHGAEYRAQRFIPNVNVSKELVALVADSKVKSYTDNGNGTATIVMTATTAPAADVKIPQGLAIWIEDVFATDIVGDSTSQEKAWIVTETDVATEGTNDWEIVVASVDMSGKGTREICDGDGENLTASSFADKLISCPEAGKYFCGFVRANGAYEFETLEKLDAAGADYKKETVGGVTVHENKLIDLNKMVNITRFDSVILAGVVEPRAVTYVMIK